VVQVDTAGQPLIGLQIIFFLIAILTTYVMLCSLYICSLCHVMLVIFKCKLLKKCVIILDEYNVSSNAFQNVARVSAWKAKVGPVHLKNHMEYLLNLDLG